MNDNETIKALECCSNQMYFCNDKQCKAKTIGNAIDLINRQKAEIESMQKTIFKKEDLMQMLCSQKQVYYDELVSAKTEIERLKDKVKRLQESVRLMLNYDDGDERIKTEARKEFVEKLKAEINELMWAYPASEHCERIDNLVKEMENKT